MNAAFQTLQLHDDDWDQPLNSNFKSHSSKKGSSSLLGGQQNDNDDEPILKENHGRFVLFPIQYHEIWQSYKNAEAKFWSAEEIELSEDTYSFDGLSGKEKAFLVQSFALLSSSDRLLGQSVFMSFGSEIQVPEARCYFGFQTMQENIHKELYNVFLQVFGEKLLNSNRLNGESIVQQQKQEEEAALVEETLKDIPSVSKKVAWVQQHILDSCDHFSVKIMGLAIYHYVFHAGLDAMLLHFASVETETSSTKNVIPATRYKTDFPGIIKSTCKIMRVRRSIVQFVSILRNLMKNKASENTVKLMLFQAVAIEKEIVKDVLHLAGGQLTLNGRLVDESKVNAYIEFASNELLTMLFGLNYENQAQQQQQQGNSGNQNGGGLLLFPKIGVEKSPLPWMSLVSRIEAENDGDVLINVMNTNKLSGNNNNNNKMKNSEKQVEKELFTLDADF